jgi:transposase
MNGLLPSSRCCRTSRVTFLVFDDGRVATRYDKLAVNYLAFIKLASIRIWLRANEFAP